MSDQLEEHDSLSGKNQDKEQRQKDQQILAVNNTTTSLLTLGIIMFVAILLYQMTQRVFTLSAKQEQMKDLLDVYKGAVDTLQLKLKMLNLTTGNPFMDHQQKKYDGLIQEIKNIEDTIRGVGKDVQSEQVYNEYAKVINDIQKALKDRLAVINLLVAHSKQQIRKNKVQMFEKIGKKQEFQEEKIRNPWALSRINLKTPYIDTLQRRHMEEEVQKQIERLQQKYHFSLFEKELPLCVVVTTRNNVKNYRYEYNLQSILNQNYQNYKLVVIDDASDDGTGDLIKLFLANAKISPEKYFFIQNKERLSAVPNINNAIKNYCSKDDIAVLVSGDDQLLGKQVFNILNVVYQTKKPGLAYTNHFYGKLHENDFQKGYSRTYTLGQIKNKLYRFVGQKFGHMRTFPVSIFLQIKQQHMKYRDGRWVQATYDETFIIPILQMACDSIEYIDQYVYLYNYGTGENDGQIHHDIQTQAALYVRELPRYSCIEKYQKYVI